MTEKQRLLFSEILIMNLEFANEEDLFKRWRLSKDIRTKLRSLKRSMGIEAFEALMQKGRKTFSSPNKIVKPKKIQEVYG